MTFKWSSVLLTGLFSMVVGCQPETQSLTLERRAEALAGEIGTWAPTSAKAQLLSTAGAVLLRGTGEVLDTRSGFVQRYDPYTNTWRAMNLMCSPGFCNTISLMELPSGKVLAGVLFSGRMGGSPGMMIYEPGADSWTHASASYSRGSVTLLGSGRKGGPVEGAEGPRRAADGYHPAVRGAGVEAVQPPWDTPSPPARVSPGRGRGRCVASAFPGRPAPRERHCRR